MNLSAAESLLQRTFGFGAFRKGQRQVVSALLQGKSACAIFPTGGGKSLCYQLPALMLPGLTVVISPLIALQQDQVDFLRGKGIAAAAWNSHVDWSVVSQMKQELKAGTLKLLYLAPEKLANESCYELLKSCNVSLLAVDEAHACSEWGSSFRPDYLKLPRFAQELGCRTLLLTATATPQNEADMLRWFNIEAENSTRTGFYRPNLSFHVRAATSTSHRNALLVREVKRIRASLPLGPIIIYVTQQHSTTDLVEILKAAGVTARPYHGGMRAEERREVMEYFAKEDASVICATIAFGMGIDRANLRGVIHYNLPKSLEGYAQEVGRAGRDGLPADCVLLFFPVGDKPLLAQYAYLPTPSLAAVERLLGAVMSTRGSVYDCSPYKLTKDLDMSSTTLGMLFAFMDIYHDVVRQLTPYYATLKWVRADEPALLQSMEEGAAKAFVRARTTGSGKWRSLAVGALPSSGADEPLGNDGVFREDVMRALGRSRVQTQGSGVAHRYRILKRLQGEELAALAQDLFGRMATREKTDLERLNRSIQLFSEPACITLQLMLYFGDTSQGPEWRCGHCQSCADREDDSRVLAVTDDHAAQALARAFEAKKRAALERKGELPQLTAQHQRMLAKFLSGGYSPGMPAVFGRSTKSHPLFGFLEGFDFEEVLEVCQQLCGSKRRKQ